jgi:hypothetical protein
MGHIPETGIAAVVSNEKMIVQQVLPKYYVYL